ncbi:MAG: cytochrome P450 [Nitrosospira sp.]|nr:cytochrome P450 [Nitrosospira sp.]
MFTDSTFSLLLDPYRFISRKCRDQDADLFQTRLLLKKTVCMTGRDAAEQFYDPRHFTRTGAAPEPILATLFGKGGVQGLDGKAHRNRKQMFISVMTPENIDQLAKLTANWWNAYLERWVLTESVVLYDELQEILTGAVCTWAGVRLKGGELSRRAKELTAMFDSAAEIGPGHLQARLARRRAENWIGNMVETIRSSGDDSEVKSPLEVVAWHRDLNGELLSPRIAAVEVLNLLRPTVAISVFIVFAAHALNIHHESREKLYARENGYDELFVQEVRRLYPFFPLFRALVREGFEWEEYRFAKGMPVILDLYGTNNDPREWDSPNEFRPERFHNRDEDAFGFIPQGGGNHHVHHRCPGEWITIALMKVALEFLVFRMSYDVPKQDLSINWRQLPAIPKSRFVICNIKRPVLEPSAGETAAVITKRAVGSSGGSR